MPALSHKIVVDTNWLISYLITKQNSRFDLVLANDNIYFYTSEEQIAEFRRKIAEEKFRKYFTVEEAFQFLINFTIKVSIIKIVSITIACRDPKDNYLLSLAADANAHYIITGDKDLLILKDFENTKIVTLPQFLALINT